MTGAGVMDLEAPAWTLALTPVPCDVIYTYVVVRCTVLANSRAVRRHRARGGRGF